MCVLECSFCLHFFLPLLLVQPYVEWTSPPAFYQSQLGPADSLKCSTVEWVAGGGVTVDTTQLLWRSWPEDDGDFTFPEGKERRDKTNIELIEGTGMWRVDGNEYG